MQSLGKIVIALLLMSMQLFGAVMASVDSVKVVRGETMTLTLEIIGEKFQKPLFRTICGEEVTSSSQGESIRSEKGTFTKSTVMTYDFSLMKDCVIEPVKIVVDGKEEFTEAIDIRVIAMEVTKDSPFILSMETAKQSVYVGEPFKVVVNFKQRHDSDSVDSTFLPPKSQDIWIKEELKGRRFEEGEYSVSRLSFIMAAQKSGMLEISPAQIKIATRSRSRDALGQWLPALKWRSYFSEALDLQVLPLPPGADLVGTFTIDAKADRARLDTNEAINVTLKISGSGNFEDIDSQKPSVDGVMVYAEEGTIKGYVEDGLYSGSWTQKFAFVADGSFTIPSFTLEYFDPVLRELRTISTEPMPITIGGDQSKVDAPLKIERPEVDNDQYDSDEKEEKSTYSQIDKTSYIAIGAIIGFMVAILMMLLPWRSWIESVKERMRRPGKDDRREALMLLLNHLDDLEAHAMVEKIEAELYEGESIDIDKKRMKRLIKRLKSPQLPE